MIKQVICASAAILLQCLVLETSSAVTIVYSNDVLGDIEPCNCRNNPQGGFVRKAVLLSRISDREIIQLDAGDLLFDSTSIPSSLQEKSKLRAEYLLKSLALLKHDAVVPGEKDFALGVKTFEQLTKKSPIIFLAANLQRKNGKQFLRSDFIFRRQTKSKKPLAIGVIGLVGEKLNYPKELTVLPVIETAKTHVKKMRHKVDILIALTHQGFDADSELAKQVKGIDYIIGAHSQSFLQTPSKIGSTLIFQSSFRNQYIGLITINGGSDSVDHDLVVLDDNYEPTSPLPIKKIVDEYNVSAALFDQKLDDKKCNTEKTTSVEVQTVVRCGECHVRQFEFWRKTKHAQALTSLINENQLANSTCQNCHSTRWKGELQLLELANGKQFTTKEALKMSESIRTTDNRDEYLVLLGTLKTLNINVQCESCHLPGGKHPFSGVYKKDVENATCLKCHNQRKSASWYKEDGQMDFKQIEQKRKQVACPKGTD